MRFVEDRSAAEQLDVELLLFFCGAEAVDPPAYAFFDASGHRGHDVRFVAQGNVVENVFLFLDHAPQAVLNNDGDLVAERRIVTHRGGHSAQ